MFEAGYLTPSPIIVLLPFGPKDLCAVVGSRLARPFGDGRSQELKAAWAASMGHGLRMCMVRRHRPQQSYRGRRSSLERLEGSHRDR